MSVGMLAFLITLLSALLCGIYIPLARHLRLVDAPNARSSHSRPTPHGGGIALLLAFLVGLYTAIGTVGDWDQHYQWLAAAAGFLMLLGVVDDLRNLSVTLRLSLYGLVCLLVSASLLLDLALSGLAAMVVIAITAFAMLWLLNLYNFMDGIDGIAAIETIFVCAAAALLAWRNDGGQQYIVFCVLVAASHLGFLAWNWPGARLFMGDAGSVPSGFLLAALAVMGAVEGHLNPLCWLILLAVFITDASWTLLWRMLSRQAFTQAHRDHAYQRLSRHWRSHLKVDILLIAINSMWLLPLAWLTQLSPGFGNFLVILAYLPLLAGMAYIRRLT